MTVIAGAILLGCGGSSDGGGNGTGTCTPEDTATITITGSGVTPTAVCVLPNGTVTFRNDDTASHDIQSGATCTQLNLGVIAAGGSATTEPFPTETVCQFRDELNPDNAAFQGLVAVTDTPGTGPGY